MRVLAQDVEAGVGAGEPFLLIHADFAGHRAGFLGMLGRFAVAVHIDGKRDIAEAGQLLGAFAGVFVQAPEFMHDQDAGALPLGRIVVSEHALERLVADFVGDDLRLHGGDAHRMAQSQGEQCKAEFFHVQSPLKERFLPEL